jgi:hypothetical protein
VLSRVAAALFCRQAARILARHSRRTDTRLFTRQANSSPCLLFSIRLAHDRGITEAPEPNLVLAAVKFVDLANVLPSDSFVRTRVVLLWKYCHI